MNVSPSYKRILELSYTHHLSHLGSCLTMSPILEKIYDMKRPQDMVVLSAGHAGLAQYVEIERKSGGAISAETLIETMGVHPVRSPEQGIHVSTGSLGSGILVAVGLALADRRRDVYCVLTDGECAEGTVWEALAFVYSQELNNLHIHVNINGFSAYDAVDREYLETRLKTFCPWIDVHHTTNPTELGGLNAHYHVMKPGDYEQWMGMRDVSSNTEV